MGAIEGGVHGLWRAGTKKSKDRNQIGLLSYAQ